MKEILQQHIDSNVLNSFGDVYHAHGELFPLSVGDYCIPAGQALRDDLADEGISSVMLAGEDTYHRNVLVDFQGSLYLCDVPYKIFDPVNLSQLFSTSEPISFFVPPCVLSHPRRVHFINDRHRGYGAFRIVFEDYSLDEKKYVQTWNRKFHINRLCQYSNKEHLEHSFDIASRPRNRNIESLRSDGSLLNLQQQSLTDGRLSIVDSGDGTSVYQDDAGFMKKFDEVAQLLGVDSTVLLDFLSRGYELFQQLLSTRRRLDMV